MNTEKCITIIKNAMPHVDHSVKEALESVIKELSTPLAIKHAVIRMDNGTLVGLYTPGIVNIERLTYINEDDRFDEERVEKYELTMDEIKSSKFKICYETIEEMKKGQ